jgi:hypothetical protein
MVPDRCCALLEGHWQALDVAGRALATAGCCSKDASGLLTERWKTAGNNVIKESKATDMTTDTEPHKVVDYLSNHYILL